jgi:hypothetical protein
MICVGLSACISDTKRAACALPRAFKGASGLDVDVADYNLSLHVVREKFP